MYDWRKMTPSERRVVLSDRQASGRAWHLPPHEDFGPGDYHITAACYEHVPFIGTSPARMVAFETELLSILDACCEEVHAWCVLPNHYHCLVHSDAVKALLAELGRLHGRSSHDWNGEDGTRGRKVWHGCEERAMRSDAHFWATMNYVHNNPVHHGYVGQWEEWPFSSAKAFLAEVGREEASRIWRHYPVLDYGKGWDDKHM